VVLIIEFLRKLSFGNARFGCIIVVCNLRSSSGRHYEIEMEECEARTIKKPLHDNGAGVFKKN